MIQFAICDDDASLCTDLSARLSNYMGDTHPHHITCFASGEALLASAQPFDLIFLDIQMAQPDGMETARLLRQRDSHSLLIFVSILKEYVFDAFAVEAFDYLVKPLDQKLVGRCMDRLREHLAAPSSISLLETSGRGHSAPVDVPLACILYAQCFDHAIDVHTTSGVYRTRQSFQDFTAQLPHTGRFYVCGRGLVVNLSQVTRVLEHDLLLKNGDRISFSRNRRREIQKAYADWFADRTRKGGWAK